MASHLSLLEKPQAMGMNGPAVPACRDQKVQAVVMMPNAQLGARGLIFRPSLIWSRDIWRAIV